MNTILFFFHLPINHALLYYLNQQYIVPNHVTFLLTTNLDIFCHLPTYKYRTHAFCHQGITLHKIFHLTINTHHILPYCCFSIPLRNSSHPARSRSPIIIKIRFCLQLRLFCFLAIPRCTGCRRSICKHPCPASCRMSTPQCNLNRQPIFQCQCRARGRPSIGPRK